MKKIQITKHILLIKLCLLFAACGKEFQAKNFDSDSRANSNPFSQQYADSAKPSSLFPRVEKVSSPSSNIPAKASASAEPIIEISYSDIQSLDPDFFAQLSLDKFKQILRIKEEILAGPTNPDPSLCTEFQWGDGFNIENTPRFLPDSLPIEVLAADSLILNTSEKKKVFVCHMFPAIFVANAEIIETRFKLIEDLVRSKNNADIAIFLQEYSDKVPEDLDSNMRANSIEELLNKILPIPSELALSQAAQESAWGRGRFSIECRNYYSQVQHSVPSPKDCKALRNSSRILRNFDTILQSTQAYMLNLNTNPRYAQFREDRKNLDAGIATLVRNLDSYAEDKEYAPKIEALSLGNKFYQIDIFTDHEEGSLVKQNLH